MRETLSLIIILSTSMFWFACGGSSHDVSNPAPPPTQSQIATFAFMQEAGNLVFTPSLGKIKVTGTNMTFSVAQLIDPTTNQPIAAGIYSIILSSDGTKAVFDLWGGLDGNSNQMDIWVGNADGSGNPLQITNDIYEDVMPQFSPDGKKVVFATLQPVPGDTTGQLSQWQIAIANANGTGGEQLLPIPAGLDYQMAPTFSPDGTKIAAHALGMIAGVQFNGILVTNADGSNPIAISNPFLSDNCYQCYDRLPAFSADGRKIVFSRENFTQSPGFSDIYIMNADGSNPAKLTDGVGLNSDPLMLNIGTGMIVFNSNRDNLGIASGAGFELYSMNIDGTGVTRLTNNAIFDGMSQWWYQGPSSAPSLRLPSHVPFHGAARGLRW